ncbi:MAG: 4Fe-4S dicluster domain-containing protein [Phycisphaerae bacterium]|nr:4Fe-4S dicluster domain-containing protein [Phycisphaerae bacterium]
MNTAFITTIQERCRVCYTCVRECPAKAIRIVDGQAAVIGDRCIACGNCVKVCSQMAKQIRRTVNEAEAVLGSGRKTVACLAPSFPAAFVGIPAEVLVGMVRRLGFDWVNEVAFGADLVAREYRTLLANTNGHRYIATTCPAVVGYIERYQPDLLDALAPIVSPMIATARALRALHGENLGIVFIGPCIGKKAEASDAVLAGEIDAVLTFSELTDMFAQRGIAPETTEPDAFDPPHGGLGALFPIGRGLLQAAGMSEDLMTGEIVATDGRAHVVDAVKEFASGDLGARLLEMLCCHGCIMGAGIDNDLPLFNRRRQVREYVRGRMAEIDPGQWQRDMDRFADLDLTRGYTSKDQRIAAPEAHELEAILAMLGKTKPEDELNCGACGYDTCREHAVAIHKGLAEAEMCLPYAIEWLRRTISKLATSNAQLASAQEALVHSEKLASMGQLAAGIAHEVNNPLGVVLMYAHLLLEEASENGAMREDLTMIAEQADRCKKIVAGLLQFARQNKVVRYPVDLRELVDRALRPLAVPPDVRIRVCTAADDPVAEIDRDQIIQVLTNLIHNAFAAMPSGGTVTITLGGDARTVQIQVEDTGTGIPPELHKKVFEPFFTTKQIGQGTGLGLSVTYGIVKMHSGDIQLKSNADPAVGPTGTIFTVTLPRSG